MDTEEKCETCKYFGGYKGCKRHAPVYVQWKQGPVFPNVQLDDWCGDYERNTLKDDTE